MIQFDSYFSDEWFNHELDNVKALDFLKFWKALKQGKFCRTVADVVVEWPILEVNDSISADSKSYP